MARYTEPWDRILQFALQIIPQKIRPDVKWDVKVYDRGPDGTHWEDAYPHSAPPPCMTILRDKNVGREAYPILNFMFQNYDNLPDITVFIPAHWWSDMRLSYLYYIFNGMYDSYQPVPQPWSWEVEKKFTIDYWGGSAVNSENVKTQPFTKARIRPYGEWYNARIPIPWSGYITLTGTFSCHRHAIHRYSKEMYAEWVKEIEEDGPNSEVAHYWERSYYTMFA